MPSPDDRGDQSASAALRRVVQLPPKLANQIAAGEVVARPASVVKELCENSVDAGATRIRIEIEGGGVELVRVVDDGCGMPEEDARLAMCRHATSKIRTVEDLRAIATLGFRGEALPSIASVSRLRLVTRPRAAEAGVAISCEGGEALDVRPCGAAPGTAVEVRDLFFNVPARRKFLRATATESAHVSEVARDLALAHHAVGIELYRDGRTARRWLPAGSRAERVAMTLEGQALMPCRGERGGMAVEAFLSRPERARTGAAGLAIFVCGRPVRDRALARAVASAYGPVLERGRYPVGVLFVDLPLELVDVNVHPQKAEVRFAQARAVTDAVYAVVAAAVAEGLDLPIGHKAAPVWASPLDAGDEPWSWHGDTSSDGRGPADGTLAVSRPGEVLMAAEPLAPARAPLSGARRHLATLRDRYLLYETADGLELIDGRRARAERLTRELHAELGRGSVVAQRLLFPISTRCEPSVVEAALGAAEALSRLGFEVRAIGPDELTSHTVPRLLADGPAEQLLDDVIDSLRRAASPPFGIDVGALLAQLAASTAESTAAPAPSELDEGALAGAVVREIRFDELR